MSELKAKLDVLVANSWRYGGDIGTNGEVFETTADTIEAAAREYLRPEQCLIKTTFCLPFDDFKFHKGISFDTSDDDQAADLARHNDLAQLLEAHNPVYAAVGDESFYPENLSLGYGVGGFFHCLFIKPGEGKNLLIVFECSL